MKNTLLNINKGNIKGTNFYFKNSKKYGLQENDLIELKLSKDVFLDKNIINLLIKVNKELQRENLEIFIKEGYRSEETYIKVYKLRVEKFGKKDTDKLLNIKDMPHSKGNALDITLFDIKKNKCIDLHIPGDGIESFNKNYYINSNIEIHNNRTKLEKIMNKYGFFNLEHEYFHYNYLGV